MAGWLRTYNWRVLSRRRALSAGLARYTIVFTDHRSRGPSIFLRSYCAIECQLNTVLQQTWRHCSESHDEWRHSRDMTSLTWHSFLAAVARTQDAEMGEKRRSTEKMWERQISENRKMINYAVSGSNNSMTSAWERAWQATLVGASNAMGSKRQQNWNCFTTMNVTFAIPAFFAPVVMVIILS